jgi:hypothetical protein
MKSLRRTPSFHPLAACLALALGAPAADAVPPHPAFVVQNCLDHGPGSLRQAVIDDTTGEPIDLTQLTCSQITLTTGQINVQRELQIEGPGAALLTIDGAGLDRVFNQNSTQALFLYGMTIQNGYANSLGGGCVYSAGALALKDTVVRNCRVSDSASTATVKGGGVSVHGTLVVNNSSIVDNEIYSALGKAFGGGASTDGEADVDHSTISGNVVSGASDRTVAVGGLDVGGALVMGYSTVSNNRAFGAPAAPGYIGGVRVLGGAVIAQSTISGNRADGGTGGLWLVGSASRPNQIIGSTISGNSAGVRIGGLELLGPTSILNSTIVFNVEAGSSGGGVYIYDGFAGTDIESTIIAGNTSAGGSTHNIGLGHPGGGATGANNLIGASPSVTLPADTIAGDPKLLPLNDNGGPTKTHALSPGSPAVDAGNTVSGYTVDQRGTGFPRVIGSFADIGAFEGVDADSIFYNGFD